MSDESCRTRYPILFIHGCGFRDLALPLYWGRIPKALTSRGATVYYGKQDAWAGTEVNAKTVKETLEEILKETACGKVNIIAHSKGGLEARYLASTLGMHAHIASITTIGTPHHGSRTIDMLMETPKGLRSVIGFFVNVWFRMLGDKKPDFMAVTDGFTTAYAKRFNEENPDMPDIACRSFACAMKSAFSDMLMFIPYLVVHHFDGECDGLVSVKSASWGDQVTVLRSDTRRGISHEDEIDLRRSRMTKKTDIVDVYVGIVKELKENGY